MKVKALVLFLSFTLVFLLALACIKREKNLKEVLPKQIEVSKIILTKEQIGLGQGCGLTIFKLSDDTKRKINQQGLSFLKNAIKARGYESTKRTSPYYLYQEWQQTPIQETKENKNFWAGLSCANQLNLDKSLSEKIIQEVTTENSYYTGHYEGQLVIIPNMGIVIFSYAG